MIRVGSTEGPIEGDENLPKESPRNAFENSEQPPMFELIQRELSQEDVDDAVSGALEKVPPNEAQLEGIRKNIAALKANGNWATARFYETLLAKREAEEG